MSNPALRPELGLEDLAWLRRLAARLVRDPHTAEDAVQDTLVSALEGAPRRGASPRAWLARVLRNTLRQQWRARARRERREALVTSPAGEREPHEVVAELALHRRLADEVERLAEPYRTAVLLRYLRGVDVAAIARELGLPEKTVRTRLERGLGQLRARLGRDRGAWLACLGFLRPARPAFDSAPLPWLFAMNLKLASAVAGLSLLGVYFVLRPSEGQSARGTSLPEAPLAVADEPELRAQAPASAQRALATEPDSAPAAGAREAGSAAFLIGSVRTLDGAGVASTVAFTPAEEGAPIVRVESDALGRFELPLPTARGKLGLEDEAFVALSAPFLDGMEQEEPLLVVAPAQRYGGIVRAQAGTPLADAWLSPLLGQEMVQSRNVGGRTIHLQNGLTLAHTDEFGHFRDLRVGYVPGSLLRAGAEGYVTQEFPLPADPSDELELVLEPQATGQLLHGLVRHADGRAASGARVSVGLFTVASEADGRFVIAADDWQMRGWLRAFVPGLAPAELDLAALTRPSSPEEPLVLTLGGPLSAVRGRVLAHDGRPVPGAVVFTPDTTPFGHTSGTVNGQEVLGETTIETFAAGPMEFVAETRADADGVFALAGLLPRPYAFFALDPRTLASAGPLNALPGAGPLEFVLEEPAPTRVAGRVRSRWGQALPGIEVSLERALAWRPDASARAARWKTFMLAPPEATWSASSPAATSDSEGRFDLGTVAIPGTHLILHGPGLSYAR
ncbi:MAG: sigma-70 family RNA polymerase sigma factor, partial [Planctomycetota bacterium]